MPKCECLETCIFFNDKMKDKPITSERYKRIYCLEDNINCARYFIFKKLGKTSVPTDLFPIDMERAKKIVSEI